MSSSGGPRMFVAGRAPPCKPSLQRTIQSHALSAEESSGPSANVGVTSPARPDRCQTHAGERLSARQTPHPASIGQGPAAADAPERRSTANAHAMRGQDRVIHQYGQAPIKPGLRDLSASGVGRDRLARLCRAVNKLADAAVHWLRYGCGMNRLWILASLALACASLAAPARATPIALSEISRYFNSFSTAQADFTQVNADGSLATGRLMIHRPGRIRFEYDPPDPTLVMATGGSVNIFDARSNSGPTSYPLNRTPLALILGSTVNLDRARMVVAHGEDGQTTFVVAQDPDHPEYGHIRLVFSADPTELRQWIVTDDTGRETTVILGTLATGVSLGGLLFNLDAELARRGVQIDR